MAIKFCTDWKRSFQLLTGAYKILTALWLHHRDPRSPTWWPKIIPPTFVNNVKFDYNSFNGFPWKLKRQSIPVAATAVEPGQKQSIGYPELLNSMAPWKFEWNFRHVIFKKILVIDGSDIFCEIALIWMSLDFTGDRSILVQVMTWCHQATSHYLSQCWPRSLSPYDIISPQWVD